MTQRECIIISEKRLAPGLRLAVRGGPAPDGKWFTRRFAAIAGPAIGFHAFRYRPDGNRILRWLLRWVSCRSSTNSAGRAYTDIRRTGFDGLHLNAVARLNERKSRHDIFGLYGHLLNRHHDRPARGNVRQSDGVHFIGYRRNPDFARRRTDRCECCNGASTPGYSNDPHPIFI